MSRNFIYHFQGNNYSTVNILAKMVFSQYFMGSCASVIPVSTGRSHEYLVAKCSCNLIFGA